MTKSEFCFFIYLDCSPRRHLYFFECLQSLYRLSRYFLYFFEISRRAPCIFNRYLSTNKIQLVLYPENRFNSEILDCFLIQNKISVDLLIFNISISVLIPIIKNNILFCINSLYPQI